MISLEWLKLELPNFAYRVLAFGWQTTPEIGVRLSSFSCSLFDQKLHYTSFHKNLITNVRHLWNDQRSLTLTAVGGIFCGTCSYDEQHMAVFRPIRAISLHNELVGCIGHHAIVQTPASAAKSLKGDCNVWWSRFGVLPQHSVGWLAAGPLRAVSFISYWTVSRCCQRLVRPWYLFIFFSYSRLNELSEKQTLWISREDFCTGR